MRRFVLVLALAIGACSSVDDFPLGGPYGGTTEPTPPNAGETASVDAGALRDAPETLQLARGTSDR